MDELLQAANQHASKITVSEEEIDQSQFLEFMDKNPVWYFYSISKDEYLSKSREEKVSLISKYYNEMKSGENSFVFIFLEFGLVLFSFLKLRPFFVIVTFSAAMIPKKANMLYLSKEATDKGRKLKKQMIMSTDTDTKNTEYIWKKDGFFGDQRGDLTVLKKNFPENTLVFCNQGTISTMKGELAIYLINVVLGQVLSMVNCPPDLDGYVCERNEVKMLLPKYNVET